MVEFEFVLPSDFKVCDHSMQCNEESLDQLLLGDVATGERNIANSKYFDGFVLTYLMMRNKPVAADCSNVVIPNPQSYSAIDRKIVAVLTRMISIAVSGKDTEILNKHAGLMSIPTTMDLIAILGDSNAHISSQYVNSLTQLKSLIAMKLEYGRVVDETLKVVHQLRDSSKLLMEEIDSLKSLQLNASGKLIKKEVVVQQKVSVPTSGVFNRAKKTLRTLTQCTSDSVDLVLYVTDIATCHASWLKCLATTVSSTSASPSSSSSVTACGFAAELASSLASEGRVTQLGKTLVSTLQMMYDHCTEALLSCCRALSAVVSDNHQQAQMQDCQRLIIVVRKLVLQGLHAIMTLCSGNSAACPSGAASDSDWEGMTWLQCSQWLLRGCDGPETAHCASDGSLVLDAMKVYSRDFMTALTAGEGGESEEVCYLQQVLMASHGFLIPPSPCHNQSASSTVKKSSAPNTTSPPPALSSSSSSQEEALSSLKSLFPDYGRLFLEACLKAFDGSVERTVDALLTDNLPPGLVTMDRSIEKVHIGKGKVASKQEEQKFQALQKTRVRLMQQQEENDFALLNREYNDDYDDQYDDTFQVQTSGGLVSGDDTFRSPVEDGAPVKPEKVLTARQQKKLSTKQKQANNGVKINWEVKMSEMKRVNDILREEEKEEQFWEGMKNHNKDRSVGQEGGECEDDDDDDQGGGGPSRTAKTKISVASPPIPPSNKQDQHRQNTQNKPNGAGDKSNNQAKQNDNSPRFRTKTFDRHHQKDKALRKFNV